MTGAGDVPSGINLTSETGVLKADLVVGLEQTLFGPASSAVTIQSSGANEQSRMLNHPSPYYLARIAFLHLDSASVDDVNSPFKLAVGMQSHLLDVENAALMSDEELQSLGYADQDGIRLTLLDVEQRDIRSHFISFKPAPDDAGEFKVRSIGSRYADASLVDDGLVESAYRVSSELGDTPAIQPSQILNPLHLGALRVIVSVLQGGQPDQAAVANLAEASAHGNTLSLVDEGLKAAQRSRQYLYAMFKKAIESQDLIAYLSAHQ